jgi:N-acetylneuraminate lyase
MKFIAAAYAPMTLAGSLNPKVVSSYGKFLRTNGVYGAFINGSTGDFVSLSTPERKQLLEFWVDRRPSDLYLINHVGHNNLLEAKELAAHSVGKADAIGALAPFYFVPKTISQLVAYCREIALAAPELPFYYYHIPVLTGVDFDMSDFVKIATAEIPSFAGLKFTEDDLQKYRSALETTTPGQQIFFGVDERMHNSLSYGATGWVGSTYNHIAPLYHEIGVLYAKGAVEEAASLQHRAIRFVEILASYGGFPGASKSFMRHLGLDMGPSRFPHHTLTSKELDEVIRDFDREGILPYLSKISH